MSHNFCQLYFSGLCELMQTQNSSIRIRKKISLISRNRTTNSIKILTGGFALMHISMSANASSNNRRSASICWHNILLQSVTIRCTDLLLSDNLSPLAVRHHPNAIWKLVFYFLLAIHSFV